MHQSGELIEELKKVGIKSALLTAAEQSKEEKKWTKEPHFCFLGLVTFIVVHSIANNVIYGILFCCSMIVCVVCKTVLLYYYMVYLCYIFLNILYIPDIY